jgi:hypothetical protein
MFLMLKFNPVSVSAACQASLSACNREKSERAMRAQLQEEKQP